LVRWTELIEIQFVYSVIRKVNNLKIKVMKIVNENKLSVEQLILRLSKHDECNEIYLLMQELGIGVEDRDNMRCIEL
jgi:hypothetical protein